MISYASVGSLGISIYRLLYFKVNTSKIIVTGDASDAVLFALFFSGNQLGEIKRNCFVDDYFYKYRGNDRPSELVNRCW